MAVGLRHSGRVSAPTGRAHHAEGQGRGGPRGTQPGEGKAAFRVPSRLLGPPLEEEDDDQDDENECPESDADPHGNAPLFESVV